MHWFIRVKRLEQLVLSAIEAVGPASEHAIRTRVLAAEQCRADEIEGELGARLFRQLRAQGLVQRGTMWGFCQ